MQYHYVISFDNKTSKWILEDDSRYLDGNVWDTENQEWLVAGVGIDDTEDLQLRSLIIDNLDKLNNKGE